MITESKADENVKFKQEMQNLFRMSYLNLLSFYLGMEVRQGTVRITISLSAYAHNLLEKSGMAGSNPCQVPMEPRFKLSKASMVPTKDATVYRNIVGTLRYLVHTKAGPDVFGPFRLSLHGGAGGGTSRCCQMDSSLRRQYNTPWLQVCKEHRCSVPHLLQQHRDTDLGGDMDTRKSTFDTLHFLGSSPVTRHSQKQKNVALSGCESEYVTATTAACQGIWLARLKVNLAARRLSVWCSRWITNRRSTWPRILCPMTARSISS